jgi:hypothetical protein
MANDPCYNLPVADLARATAFETKHEGCLLWKPSLRSSLRERRPRLQIDLGPRGRRWRSNQ